MWVPLRTSVRADNHHRRAQIFDEMPASSRNGEQILIIVHVSKNLQSGMMLEEEIHLDANPSNVLEHIGELHVLGIRAPTVKTTVKSEPDPKCKDGRYSHIMVVQGQNVGNLRESFAKMGLIKVAGVVMKVGMSNILLMLRCPRRILAVILATHRGPLFQ